MPFDSSCRYQIVGEVLKQLTEDKFIVKATNGPRYVVGCRRQLDKEKLKVPRIERYSALDRLWTDSGPTLDRLWTDSGPTLDLLTMTVLTVDYDYYDEKEHNGSTTAAVNLLPL